MPPRLRQLPSRSPPPSPGAPQKTSPQLLIEFDNRGTKVMSEKASAKIMKVLAATVFKVSARPAPPSRAAAAADDR